MKYNDFQINIIIAVGEYQDDENKCIMALNAFRKNESGISKSEKASIRLESIIHDIKGFLKDVDSKLVLSPYQDVDNYVSLRAYDHALSATKSKIEEAKILLSGIPRKYKIVTSVIIIAIFLLSIFCYFGLIDMNNYIGIVAILIHW